MLPYFFTSSFISHFLLYVHIAVQFVRSEKNSPIQTTVFSTQRHPSLHNNTFIHRLVRPYVQSNSALSRCDMPVVVQSVNEPGLLMSSSSLNLATHLEHTHTNRTVCQWTVTLISPIVSCSISFSLIKVFSQNQPSFMSEV